MKKYYIVLISFFCAISAFCQYEKCYSPYLWVKNDFRDKQVVNLLNTQTQVDIVGPIADVRISQLYVNQTDSLCEVNYIFPVQPKASVYELNFRVGNRRIIRKVKPTQNVISNENEQPNAHPLLIEYRDDVIISQLGNVKTDDTIKVEVKYSIFSSYFHGRFLVFPFPMTPKYSKTTEMARPGIALWANQQQAIIPKNTLDIKFNNPIPLKYVVCTTHKTKIDFSENQKLCKIQLDESYRDKNFELQYEYLTDRNYSDLVISSDSLEKYMMIMFQSGYHRNYYSSRTKEVVFMIDILKTNKKAKINQVSLCIKKLLESYKGFKKFNIVINGETFSNNFLYSHENSINESLRFLKKTKFPEKSQITKSLKKAFSLEKNQNCLTTYIIISDMEFWNTEDRQKVFDFEEDKADFFFFDIGDGDQDIRIIDVNNQIDLEFYSIDDRRFVDGIRNFYERKSIYDIKVNLFHNEINFSDELPSKLNSEKWFSLSGKINLLKSDSIGLSYSYFMKRANEIFNFSKTTIDSSSALKYLWARKQLTSYHTNNKTLDSINIKNNTKIGLKYNMQTKFTDYAKVQRITKNHSGQKDLLNESLIRFKDNFPLYEENESEIKHLKFRGSRIFSSEFPRLDSIASILDADKKLHLIVIGHTDDVGSSRYNKKLSYKRAESVLNYLNRKEDFNNRVVAYGMGEVAPIASNKTIEGRAKNRRIEFIFRKNKTEFKKFRIFLSWTKFSHRQAEDTLRFSITDIVNPENQSFSYLGVVAIQELLSFINSNNLIANVNYSDDNSALFESAIQKPLDNFIHKYEISQNCSIRYNKTLNDSLEKDIVITFEKNFSKYVLSEPIFINCDEDFDIVAFERLNKDKLEYLQSEFSDRRNSELLLVGYHSNSKEEQLQKEFLSQLKKLIAKNKYSYNDITLLQKKANLGLNNKYEMIYMFTR